jgi:hypothetical protein
VRRVGTRSALLVLLAAVVVAAPAQSAREAGYSDSTPMTISYQGTLDLTNTMVPSGVQHSFVYHVQWSYAWAGTWGELFAGKTFSNQTSFQRFHLSGSMRATWRESQDGPQLSCTLRIVPAMDEFANFGARYDSTAGTLKLVDLQSGAGDYGSYVGSSDPMCGGGPDIDMFSVPPSWHPLGASIVTLGLAGGVHHYDKTWRWTHRFDARQHRDYVSSMHSTVTVSFP